MEDLADVYTSIEQDRATYGKKSSGPAFAKVVTRLLPETFYRKSALGNLGGRISAYGMANVFIYFYETMRAKFLLMSILIGWGVGLIYAQLTMAQQQGMGVLSIRDNRLVNTAILHENEWVGEWQYSVHDTIQGIGDFEGDGNKDFIIMSKWEIGILTHSGSDWRMLVAQPSGTWFGGWNFNYRL